mgnify:CR=1 FL=1
MKIADGVYVHFIPTQKYKTNRIVFRMTGSLNKQTIAKRALVSQMLLQPIRRIQQYSLLKRD